jgi:predicted dehydrogenase
MNMTFRDNGDRTIHDSRTGLVWQQAENVEEMNYEDAVAFCESLTLAGHSNWRLPTKEELVALAQVGDEPLREFFPGIQQERYWASTRRSELAWAESPDRIAYTVDFDPDSGNYCHPTTYFRSYEYFVRAVRAGGEVPPTASEASGAEGYNVQRTLSGHTKSESAIFRRHKKKDKRTGCMITLVIAILFFMRLARSLSYI